MASGGLICECGAPTRESAGCEAIYHEILAAEQLDPVLARWHPVVVCAYLLQHPSRGREAFLDGQFRMLQLYRERGLDALLRLAAHQRARNRHSVRAAYDFAPLEPFASLPDRRPPDRFDHGLQDLHDLVGTFESDGYRIYEQRLNAIVDATIAAWADENVAERRGK